MITAPSLVIANPDVQRLIAKMADAAGKVIAEHLSKMSKGAVDRARVAFLYGFDDYLKSSYEKCRFVKTILSPDVPTPTDELYVNVTLKSKKTAITDDVLIDTIESYRLVLVTGSAGSGKSWFMKHLILRRFESSFGKIPLFVELRHLNGLSTPDLLTFVSTQSGSAKNNVSREQFELAMAAGSILLVLDGFDEVEHVHRDNIERQILDIRRVYPAASVVVSSRFDPRFGSWEPFYQFKMDELSLKQVIELIQKLDYDGGVKKKFIDALKKGLYERHKSFLYYPLLVTIMLMTYRQYAEIADKISIFYEQAFETLYLRHDAMKDQFKRRKYTDLAIDDFRDCFAVFCATTYIDEKFSFTDRELRSAARIAIKQSKTPIKAEDFIKDLRECVCMLQQDGLDTSFVHRSFQEYFAAVFCSTCNGADFKHIVDSLIRRSQDSVLPMLLEMVREKLEQEWVKDQIERLLKLLLPRQENENLAEKIQLFFSAISFHIGGRALTWGLRPNNHYEINVVDAIRRLYPRIIKQDFWACFFVPPRGLEEFHELLLNMGYSSDKRFKELENVVKAYKERNPTKDIAVPAEEEFSHWFDWEFTSDDDQWMRKIGAEQALADWVSACDRILAEIKRRKEQRSSMIGVILQKSGPPRRTSRKKQAT